MVYRCNSPKARGYRHWGGRGIKVCDRWQGRDGFANFLADLGERPSRQHSIDRIDNNGNYEPDNCRWATSKEQANNRRDNHLIAHDGITLNATQWADRTGLKRVTIRQRLRNGWTPEEALTTPPDSRHQGMLGKQR